MAMVKGLANVDIQAELLAEVEQMFLEITIAFVEIRESEVLAANANSLSQPQAQQRKSCQQPLSVQCVDEGVWVQAGKRWT